MKQILFELSQDNKFEPHQYIEEYNLRLGFEFNEFYYY